jgi:DNA polymerase III delta prime subunit
MIDYDFSTLNPTDFEKLVCDLLNMKINARNGNMFRSFKEGKDSGIDLLFSTKEKDLEIVVQVKHYNKSSFATLKRDLIKNEIEKVRKINPEHYIFVTSIGLSKHNKDEIKEIFSPYISSLTDVLGRDDLNDLLRLNKAVEEKHFKLWFSSTIAIQKILQYKFYGRQSEFQESEIKKRLRLFVSTKELGVAIRILNMNKFLIITGEPGVGKTTMSEILIYKFISKGYDLTVIYDEIKEIELTLRDDDSKQIFYFDDFLGHTQAEIQKSKSAETSLLKIISRIEKAENKFLILNTRKFILNTFLDESERFRNFNPIRGESKIELRSYSYGAKRRMLDNHIAEYELSPEKNNLLKNLSNFICDHKNFSPRHLEFFTNKNHIGNLNNIEFKSFVLDNLENPKKIWEHAYNNQITDLERFLLNTLYSLGSNSTKEILEIAFNSRIEFEVEKNNFFKPLNPFNDCLRKLNDGFILNFKYNSKIQFSFINPSLEDFLKYSIDKNVYELERILLSASFIDQWFVFFKPFSDGSLTIKLKAFFIDKFLKSIEKEEDKYKAVFFLFSYAYEELLLICNLLNSIKDWSFIRNNQVINVYSLMFLKQSIKKEYKKKVLLYQLSILNENYYFSLILSCQTLEELYELVFLFSNHFGLNFKHRFNNNSVEYGRFKNLIKEVYELCENLLIEEIDLQYKNLSINMDTDAHLDVIEKIESYINFIKEQMFNKFNINYETLINPNWNEIAEQNHSNFLSSEMGLDINSENEDYNSDFYNYEEYEDEDYDFDKEKINSWQIIKEYDIIEDDDLPF